jgi:hypothetical protein
MRIIFNGVTTLEPIAYFIVAVSAVGMIGYGVALALH